ncbi:MAG: hypothetical protein M3N91_17535 [Pseudomonadota bacterium]|nr:hypothetical protein [Pseudomonadota bacterium]
MRTLELDLVPDGIIEVFGAGLNERCFFGDRDSPRAKKLAERLPHPLIRTFSARVVEKNFPLVRPEEPEHMGYADFCSAELTLVGSRSLFDEIIAEERLGRKIASFWITMKEGMKVAQKQNNEDHLVSYIWEIPDGDRYYHGSTVTDWVVYYDQSPVYAPPAPREDAEPEPSSRIDIAALAHRLELLIAETRTTNLLVKILCGVAVLGVIVAWWKG